MKLIIATGPAKSGKTTAARERYEQETARIASQYTPEQQAGVDPPDEVVMLLTSWGDLDVALRPHPVRNAIVILDMEGTVELSSVELITYEEDALDPLLPDSKE